MRSTAEALEGNKVRLSVEVDESELKSAVDDTMRRLQREVRVPGFRPGKVPRRLLEVRLGPKAIREEVIRNSLPDYYSQAVEEAALDAIAPPEIDITSGEEDGPLAFSAVVEVRPKVSVAGYEGLQVTLASPEPSEEEVADQIDRLREQFAELSEVSRPARAGDLVTIDVSATRSGEPAEDLSTRDFVYEIGTGMVAPSVDEELEGARAGDILDISADDAPGGRALMKVLVKQVREKVLPDADDEWASEASEFETLEELREDVRKRIVEVRRLQSRLALREGAVEELAKLVDAELPETLVARELDHLRSHLSQSLAERKVTLAQYLEATGQDEEQLDAELGEQASRQVRTDLALRALAEAEGLAVTDEELASEVEAYARSSGRPPELVARQFAGSGALEGLRSEIRSSKAVAWLVENVELVDEQGSPLDRTSIFGGGPEAEESEPEGAAEPDEGEPDEMEKEPDEMEKEEA